MGITPAITAAIIGGGAAVGSAAIGAHAAGSAADTQAQSARDALNLQSQIYGQTRSDLLPYNAAGQGALGNLQRLLGLSPATQLQGGPTVQAPTQGPVPGQWNFGSPGNPAPPMFAASGGLTPYYQPGGPGAGLINQMAGSSTALANRSAYTTMRAPDGSTQAVPGDQVAQWQARGAQIVS